MYSWQSVGVLDYNPEKKQYMVHKADQNGCVRDSKGKPVVGGAQRNKGKCQTYLATSNRTGLGISRHLKAGSMFLLRI